MILVLVGPTRVPWPAAPPHPALFALCAGVDASATEFVGLGELLDLPSDDEAAGDEQRTRVSPLDAASDNEDCALPLSLARECACVPLGTILLAGGLVCVACCLNVCACVWLAGGLSDEDVFTLNFLPPVEEEGVSSDSADGAEYGSSDETEEETPEPTADIALVAAPAADIALVDAPIMPVVIPVASAKPKKRANKRNRSVSPSPSSSHTGSDTPPASPVSSSGAPSSPPRRAAGQQDENARQLLQDCERAPKALLDIMSSTSTLCAIRCGACGVCVAQRRNTTRRKVVLMWAKAYPRRLWERVGQAYRLNLSEVAKAKLKARGLDTARAFRTSKACEAALLSALLGVPTGVLTQHTLSVESALGVLNKWYDLDPASFHTSWVNPRP